VFKVYDLSPTIQIQSRPFAEDFGGNAIKIKDVYLQGTVVNVPTASIVDVVAINVAIYRNLPSVVGGYGDRNMGVYASMIAAREAAIGVSTPYSFGKNIQPKVLVIMPLISAKKAFMIYTPVVPAGSTGNVKLVIDYEVVQVSEVVLAGLEALYGL
jgi:hypothetical protein